MLLTVKIKRGQNRYSTPLSNPISYEKPGQYYAAYTKKTTAFLDYLFGKIIIGLKDNKFQGLLQLIIPDNSQQINPLT